MQQDACIDPKEIFPPPKNEESSDNLSDIVTFSTTSTSPRESTPPLSSPTKKLSHYRRVMTDPDWEGQRISLIELNRINEKIRNQRMVTVNALKLFASPDTLSKLQKIPSTSALKQYRLISKDKAIQGNLNAQDIIDECNRKIQQLETEKKEFKMKRARSLSYFA